MLLIVTVTAPILDEEPHARRCLGVLLFAAVCWCTEALPLFVTSLCIPLLVVLFGVLKSPDTSDTIPAPRAAQLMAAPFFDPVIFLFLGAFVMAQAVEKYELSKRLSAIILKPVAPYPALIHALFVATALSLSMFMSNVAAAVLCTSVALPLLSSIPEQHRQNYSRSLLLTIAYACNIGGMTTPIASPQNAIAIASIRMATGGQASMSFFEWTFSAFPSVLLLSLALLAIMLLLYRPQGAASLDAVALKTGFFWPHWTVAGTCACVLVMWVFEGAFKPWVGSTGITAIIPLIVFYGSGILSVKEFNSLSWSVLILIGGGLSLGVAIQSSNLLNITSQQISHMVAGLPLWAVSVAFTALLLLAGNVISSTVAAIVVFPVVAAVGHALGHARLLVFAAALMDSGAMMLPVSSFPNANAYAVTDRDGKLFLDVFHYLRSGVPVTLVCFLLNISVTYLVGMAQEW